MFLVNKANSVFDVFNVNSMSSVFVEKFHFIKSTITSSIKRGFYTRSDFIKVEKNISLFHAPIEIFIKNKSVLLQKKSAELSHDHAGHCNALRVMIGSN